MWPAAHDPNRRELLLITQRTVAYDQTGFVRLEMIWNIQGRLIALKESQIPEWDGEKTISKAPSWKRLPKASRAEYEKSSISDN